MRTAVRGWAIVVGRRHAVLVLGRRAAHQLLRARWVLVEVRMVAWVSPRAITTIFPRAVTAERRWWVISAERARSIERWRRWGRMAAFPSMTRARLATLPFSPTLIFAESGRSAVFRFTIATAAGRTGVFLAVLVVVRVSVEMIHRQPIPRLEVLLDLDDDVDFLHARPVVERFIKNFLGVDDIVLGSTDGHCVGRKAMCIV